MIGNHHATGPRGLQEAVDAAEFHDAQVAQRLRAYATKKQVKKAAKLAFKGVSSVDNHTVDFITHLLEDDLDRETPLFGLEDPAVPGRGLLLETFRSYLPDDDAAVLILGKLLVGLGIDDDTTAVPSTAAAPAATSATVSNSATAAEIDLEEVDPSKMTSAQKRQLRKQRQAKAKAARDAIGF